MGLKNLHSFANGYFYALLQLFDPIENDGSHEDNHFWGHKVGANGAPLPLKQLAFLGPAISIFLLEAVGVFGLHLDALYATHNRTIPKNWSDTIFTSSPYIFSHQALPVEVWTQVDSFMVIALNGGILAAIVLTTTPLISDAYRLVVEETGLAVKTEITVEGKRQKMIEKKLKKFSHLRLASKKKVHYDLYRWTVEEREAATILTYRATIHKYFYLAHIFFVMEMSTQYVMVYMNGAFQFSFISIFFWAFIFPASMFHGVFIFYGVPIIMTLSVVVILVQQKSTIKAMRQINKQLSIIQIRNASSSPEVRREKLQLEKIKYDFSQVHKTNVQLSAALAAYSAQWTRYLSTVLPVQTIGVAYFAYIFFFGNLPTAIRYLFITADSAIALTVFTLLNLCAQIVRYNDTYNHQVELYVRALRMLRRLSPIEQLKLCQSTDAAEKGEFAFRLLDDNTLNPGTFPMIFTYCTILILMIAKSSLDMIINEEVDFQENYI